MRKSLSLTVGMCALFAGPVTGASMNPARSLAPAVVSGTLIDLWIYVTTGQSVGRAFYRLVKRAHVRRKQDEFAKMLRLGKG